jgi:tetratricopeptide (TPR) repeat protein
MSQSVAALDAKLRQAVMFHQARRLAEAETIYRQILALRPEMAEIRLNCALAQMGQGKYGEAEQSLRQALAARPDLGKAHAHLGDVLSLQQKYAEAAESYSRAIKLSPGHVEAHNNLGNARLLLGDMERAANAYRAAIKLKPDFVQAHANLGQVYLRKSLFEEACDAFRRAIALAPSYVEAQNGLGNALLKLGAIEEAEEAFRTTIRYAPNNADAHVNLSALFFEQSRLPEAETAARKAVQLNAAQPEAHNALGNVLREQGRLAEAEAEYREALRLAPDYVEGYKHLAMALEEQGRLDEAFSLFGRHAQLAFASEQAPSTFPAHKLKHDEEQRAWLGRDAGFHLGDGSRIAGAAINPGNKVSEISALWRSAQPQIVVIDDLLTPEALEKLRRFCLDSTVWRQVYDGGYLGAFPEHGFAPPLLAQIAEELRTVYPAIIEDYPLLHFWAFKYDSSLNGIKKHADFAAVNVNFWITPDEANLDPDHGGLVVWDAAAPLDWNFAKYNAAEDDITAFLKAQDSKPVTIPYRANRAVIFDSDLFHETDVIAFKPGYENRRINVTLLFGRRQKQRNQNQ